MTEQKPNTGTALTRPTTATFGPWQEFDSLRRHMDDLFARSFGYTPLSRMLPAEWTGFEPQVDIHETDEAILLHASLPGYKPEQITVEATNNTLSIRGERKALLENERAIAHQQNGVSGSSQFQIAYTLPSEIDPNKVKANFNNGVLELELPKTEQARTKSVKINVR